MEFKLILCRILATLLLCCGELIAGECLPLESRNPEGNYIVPGVMGGIVYRKTGGKELSLDAYVQKNGSRRPAVIIVHGGGWDRGSRVAFIGQFQEMLTSAGYNWFSVDYRLMGPDQKSPAIEDLRAAIDFIRCHARQFRIDPDNLTLLGEDTGAQLALEAGSSAGVRSLVLVGGRYDPPAIAADSNGNSGSPVTALIVHGSEDREVPPALAGDVCAGIKEHSGKCDLMLVDGEAHRAENWRPKSWTYKTRVLDWMGRRTGMLSPDFAAYEGKVRKNIIYNPRSGQKLDAYVPQGDGPFPAVIIVHGGGWEAGDKVSYVSPVFEPLAKAGYAFFSIDYRLVPEFRHESQIEDLTEAVFFIRNNARKFRVDPNRLALIGESASGQMVSYIATLGLRDIRAVVSFYGVYDFMEFAGEFTPRSIPTKLFGITESNVETRAILRRYSPIYNVNPKMPPMLLICGTQDRLHLQQESFAKVLNEHGVRHETYSIPNAPHGMENWEGRAEWTGYKSKLIQWLNLTLRK